MRGRLAVLLVVTLVLPLVGIAWAGCLSLRESLAGEASDDRLSVATQSALNSALDDLDTRLQGDLALLALRVAHLPPGAAADPARAFEGVPVVARPALLAVVADGGEVLPPLPPALRDALAAELAAPGPVRGWRCLPLGGATATLCDVVVEPCDGGRLLAVRPLEPLLAGMSFTDRLGRALLLRNGTLVPVGAVHPGDPAGERAADLAESYRELWAGASAEAGEGGWTDAQARHDTRLLGARPLPGPRGEPEVLVVVTASDAAVNPLLADRGARLAEAAAGLGWLAAAGVLLALLIGLLAPRFVWCDVRDDTDFLFAAVERLRELVSRIGLALTEQARVLRNLSASVARLDADSREIARTGRTLAHSAEQSEWSSQSGHQKAESAQRAVLDMRDRVEDINRQMEELDRRCSAIGSILVYIDHLTSETSAVSINATIQSAGAAGSARQLAAMAGEIQKLAELALGSTREIKQLVEEIQEASRTTVGSTQDGRQQAERCLVAFEEVEQNFGRILRWVEDTKRCAQGIEGGTVRQSEALQSVAGDVEAIEQRWRETSSNFDAVVDAADELAELGRRMNHTWRVG
jgi:Methyl-accepting chemotaxis protein (MCP) signalling domain